MRPMFTLRRFRLRRHRPLVVGLLVSVLAGVITYGALALNGQGVNFVPGLQPEFDVRKR